MVALLMSAFTFAQVNCGVKLERNTNAAKAAVKSMPKKALSANQRMVGYYTSDALAAAGLGIAPMGAQDNVRPVIVLENGMLKAFEGMKIVGIRYGILAENVVSQVFIGGVSDEGYSEPIVSKAVSSSLVGWNEVMFDEPYTIKAGDNLYAGFQYKQKATKSGKKYTNDCYPLSLVKEGVSGNEFIMWANVPKSSGGIGEAWYNFGSDMGNLSLQVIIEGDMQKYYISPLEMNDFQTVVGKEKSANVIVQYAGKDDLKNVSYTYTQNGKTSAENTVNVESSMAKSVVNFPINIAGADAPGKYDITINFTKVNGEANASVLNTIAAKNETKAKELKPVVLMEEFTGTGCGWCPRGMQGMKNAAKKFGDQFVGVAIHQYSGSDPMYTVNYANLKFAGAPSCKLNRATDDIDPYMGSEEDICDDIAEFLKVIPDAALTVKAEWGAADDGKLTATATVEAQAAKTYQLAFAVIADNVKGDGNNWNQANYYSSAYASQTGMTYENIPEDLKFLWNEYPYKPAFNDVLVASSYVRSTNKCANVDVPAEGTVEGSYEITLPVTNKVLLPALDKDQLYIVGIIIDPTTKKVVNAAKAKIPTWVTGINGVKANGENAVEVARYTMDGRQVSAPVKGINLVKMSDGTTQKVLVK